MGRVHPAGVSITIEGLPSQRWHHVEDDDDRASYALTIVESKVRVEVDTTKPYKSEDMWTLSDMTGKALNLARAAVDLFSFNMGWGLSVTLDWFVYPDGGEIILLPQLPGSKAFLSETADTAYRVEAGILDWQYEMLNSNPTIALAVNDLVGAVSQPGYAELNCARAVEGLRSAFAPTCLEREATWMNVRETLNVSETYLRSITSVSQAPRHGDRTSMEYSLLSEITNKSWTLMRRFFELKRRNLMRLPLEEFPLLHDQSPPDRL